MKLGGFVDIVGKGDSGGPLLIELPSGEYGLFGILSTGVQSDALTRYARIAPSLEWLETKSHLVLNKL